MIMIIYIPSKLNRADGLIKSMDPGPFYTFKSLIQILEVNELNKYTDGDNGDDGGPMNLNS